VSRFLAALIALAVLAACVALFGVPDAGAQRDDVTLKLERFYDNACRCYKLRFSGTIGSGAANEYVAVLQQKCGSNSATAIAGATTQQGGVWTAEPVSFGARPGEDSSTYQARWNGRLSDPLRFTGKVHISLTPLARGRYRVNVSTSATGQNMKGRMIELQRLVGGRWTLVQTASLRGARGTFTATVTARARNQSFRVFVPARSAAPCYVATPSQPFVAGRRPAPGSAAVIDRTVSCSAGVRGGLRMVEVGAFTGAEQPPLPRSAGFGVTSNWVPDASLVSASSGAVQLNPTRCTGASTSVPLVTQGLRGGLVSTGDLEYKCETPRRVLVRIRAVFHVPMKLEPDRTFGYPMLRVLGEIKEAQLAVRSPSGRSLAFASLVGGKARLLVAPSCAKDEP
jgi:hypothetical protein